MRQTGTAVADDMILSDADYQLAFLVREVEAALLTLFSEGKVSGTVHTCIGQEFTGVSLVRNLVAGDHICSNHRCHGHFLAWTGDTSGLIAEIMGKSTGVVRGIGGSQHLHATGFLSNGVQGGMMPIAAGLAWARKLRRSNEISVVFIGDGTLGEGLVYETLNIASKHGLPLLVVLENNFYAQSTHQRQTLAGDVQARARAFGVASARSDTWNLPDLFQCMQEAVAYVRSGRGPFLLQVDTYRLMAHSKGDDDRDKEEVQAFADKDPLNTFEASNPDAAKMAKVRAKEIVQRAVAEAEAAAPSQPAPTFTGTSPVPLTDWMPLPDLPADRVVNRLHEGLHANMERDDRIILLGEDIVGPYGGAFKVTKNLSSEFSGRVINMPISEAAIVGVGCGLAMGGKVPVCEIMFGDFLLLAADQLVNHAAKFAEMYSQELRVPLIVRTPMGGRRGYGPTHSQSLEKHLLGVPGLTVVAVNHRYDPSRMLDDVFARVDSPVLLLENKVLYTIYTGADVPAGYHYEQQACPFPVVRMRPEAEPSVTILCYGAMLLEAEAAAVRLFEEDEIVAEVLCPTKLYPLDLAPILASVRATGRLVVAEEGQSFAAFGAEVVAELVEQIGSQGFQVARVAPAARSIPASKTAEMSHLPNADEIIAAAKLLF